MMSKFSPSERQKMFFIAIWFRNSVAHERFIDRYSLPHEPFYLVLANHASRSDPGRDLFHYANSAKIGQLANAILYLGSGPDEVVESDLYRMPEYERELERRWDILLQGTGGRLLELRSKNRQLKEQGRL